MRARYKRYSDTVDLTGEDIVSVVWGDRDAARSLLGWLQGDCAILGNLA